MDMVVMVLGDGEQMIEVLNSDGFIPYLMFFLFGLTSTFLANGLSFIHGIKEGWGMKYLLILGLISCLLLFYIGVSNLYEHHALTLLKFVLLFVSIALGFLVGSYRFLIRLRKK